MQVQAEERQGWICVLLASFGQQGEAGLPVRRAWRHGVRNARKCLQSRSPCPGTVVGEVEEGTDPRDLQWVESSEFHNAWTEDHKSQEVRTRPALRLEQQTGCVSCSFEGGLLKRGPVPKIRAHLLGFSFSWEICPYKYSISRYLSETAKQRLVFCLWWKAGSEMGRPVVGSWQRPLGGRERRQAGPPKGSV